MKNIATSARSPRCSTSTWTIVVGDAQGEVRAEAGAHGVEPQGHPARLRLREGALPLPAAASASRRWTRRRTRSSSTATPRPRSAASTPGATVAAWYPITPSTSVLDAFKALLREATAPTRPPASATTASSRPRTSWRRSAWSSAPRGTGARAFTSTAGPGISLMNELIGLAYYAEIPAVIVDVQRVGPSTGHAHAHAAGRHPALRVRLARRHQAHPPLPGEPGRVLPLRGASRSTSPSASRRPSSC